MKYSDQVFDNVALSLKFFLAGQPALKGVDIKFTEEFEPTRGYTKPFLLIADKTTRFEAQGIDGGFFRDDFDIENGSVDTINATLGRFDFTLDLGTDTTSDRRRWGAVLDRIFRVAQETGIPVYDFAADPASTEILGRLQFIKEEDFAHNLLPEQPAIRTWRDVISFTPEYLHLFILDPDQPLLTGVELRPKEISEL